MIVDPPAFPWTDDDWTGARPRHQQVVYEMHIGTFTAAGTWAAARKQLEQLADLGITTLEIMPLAEFPGRFGWGYDGVFLFAPFHEYGDARRCAIIRGRRAPSRSGGDSRRCLQPPGSGRQCPARISVTWYFAEHETDWGRGFNLDGPHSGPVRDFMRANVRHWIREYHFDGLRFDAIHAIVDRSPEHILHELTRHARAVGGEPGACTWSRENESQDVAFLDSRDEGPGGLDGLWNEDWHHAAFVTLTGQDEAYCTDYEGTANEFAAMARWNLLYQGQWYSWQKQGRGTDARAYPSSRVRLLSRESRSGRQHGPRPASARHRDARPLAGDGGAAAARTGRAADLSGPGMRDGIAVYVLRRSRRRARRGGSHRASRVPVAVPDAQRSRTCESACRIPLTKSAFRACKLRRSGPRSEEARLLYTDLLALRRTDIVLSKLGTDAAAIASSAPTPSVVLLRYSAGARGTPDSRQSGRSNDASNERSAARALRDSAGG